MRRTLLFSFLKRYEISAIIALTLFLSCGSTKAQTAPETITWLTGRLASYCGDTGDTEERRLMSIQCRSIQLSDRFRIAYGVEDRTNRTFDFAEILFRDVTNIVQRPFQTSIQIIFLGPAYEKCNTDSSSCQRGTKVSLSLLPDTPPPEVERILKAFKHLAQLNGAKLPDEDLFK